MAGRNLDVRRVQSSLVATFAKANPPLVWRFDLERNHSFTVALQGEGNEWELGITSPKGEFTPVATFPQREDAEEALVAISEELARGPFGWVMDFLKAAGIALLIMFVVLWAGSAAMRMFTPHLPPQIVATPVQPPTATMPPKAPPPPPASENGVPLPADQVLKPPAP